MIRDIPAYKYAKWCIPKKNKKTPIYIKKQAKNWIKICDGKDKEAYFDMAMYQKVEALLGIMIHPDLRKPLIETLEPYSMWLITATFCTKMKNDSELDIRFYETIVLEIARKNFKTFVSAVIFIMLMLLDPEFSRFFSVAPDLSLSKELKLAIQKIIKVSPELYGDDPAFKILRSEVRCKITDSEYTPLAYSRDNMDGKLANAFLADEAGALDEYPVEAMRSSQITLRNKLGIIISTQYPNDDNVFIDEVDISKKVLDGVLENQRVFALLYEPDEYLQSNDRWEKDVNAIYQANPVAVEHKYIFNELLKKRDLAIEYENKKENFLCKHCNIKFKGLGVESYIDITKVKRCSIKRKKEWWQGKKVYLGLDFSLTDDNTAIAMSCMDDTGVINSKVFGFLPEGKIGIKTKREKLDYKRRIKAGDCFATGDEVIDYADLENFVLTLEADYGVEIVQIGYDRWNALSSIQKFEAAGYECVEIKQHSSVLHSPTKLLKEKILARKYQFDENELLEINFQNAKVTEDTNKNKYVNKKKTNGKVDMVVAIINSIYLVEQEYLYGSDFVVQS